MPLSKELNWMRQESLSSKSLKATDQTSTLTLRATRQSATATTVMLMIALVSDHLFQKPVALLSWSQPWRLTKTAWVTSCPFSFLCRSRTDPPRESGHWRFSIFCFALAPNPGLRDERNGQGQCKWCVGTLKFSFSILRKTLWYLFNFSFPQNTLVLCHLPTTQDVEGESRGQPKGDIVPKSWRGLSSHLNLLNPLLQPPKHFPWSCRQRKLRWNCGCAS